MIRIFILFFFLFPVFTYSQNQFNSAEDADPAAKEILDNISDYLQNRPGIKTDIVLDFYTDPNTIAESIEATLIQSGDKYNLDFGPQQFISNGQILWIYEKQFNEVSLNSVGGFESGMMTSPQTILNFYKEMDVTYRIEKEYIRDGEQLQEIVFKPIDRNLPVSKATMIVNKEKKSIKQLKAFLKDGSSYVIQLVTMDTNFTPDADVFDFDPSNYEGIHVEDLRID